MFTPIDILAKIGVFAKHGRMDLSGRAPSAWQGRKRQAMSRRGEQHRQLLAFPSLLQPQSLVREDGTGCA
jgi:hypothetical protein